MAQFTSIMASEYNAVRTKVSNIIGTGSGNKGYGGSMTSSEVAAGNLITETHFDNLKADIDKAVRHQTGLLSSLTNVAQGDIIYWATLLSYDLKADEITTNSDAVYTGATTGSFVKQVDVVNGGSTTLSAGWGVGASQRYGQQTYNVTFSSADKARQFFNSGGYLRITLSRGGSAVNTKDTGWQQIIDDMATVANTFFFDAAKYRAGVAGTTTQWSYVKYDTTNPYTENYGGALYQFVNSTTINILVQMVDNDAGDQTGTGPAVDEPVSITVTAGLEYRKSIDQITAETPTFSVAAWTLQ